ncbi:MAG TPA: endonuclease domain-containing protein [Phenylobacterium sp.]
MKFERTDGRPLNTMQTRSLRGRATWSERRFWRELRKLDANFRRQAPIGPYFADFATRHPKIAIEIDGGVHERLPDVAARDTARQRWLEQDGYAVLRFTDSEVSSDVWACLDIVKAHLSRRANATPEPVSARSVSAVLTPPSPALPPSRRKGEAP